MDGTQPAVLVAEAPPSEQAVETATDAAVQIATVQADRDVAIAETQAEAAVEIATVNAEADDEDVIWLRGELDGLRAQCETLREGLSAVTLMQNETQAQLTSLAAMLAEHTNTLTPPAHSPPPMATEPSEAESEAESEALRSATATAPAVESQATTQRRKRWL